MFKNEFQGGAYFEVFSAQGKDPVSNCKLSGGSGVKKIYDKDVKSFVYTIEGNGATTRMQLPKDPKQSLMLIQRFLVLQALFQRGQDFSIDIGITDIGNNKRRLLLSSAHKEFQVTPLHAKIPLTIVKRGVWLNLCLDLVSLVGDTWRGQTFKAVESICICANCKLRRILTMRMQPGDTTDDDEMYECGQTNVGEVDSIPRHFQFAVDVSQETQVLTSTKLRQAEMKMRGGPSTARQSVSQSETDLNSSGGKKSSTDSYHIAFGTKVSSSSTSTTIPRKGSAPRDGNLSSRINKSSNSQNSKLDEGSSTRRSVNTSSRVDRQMSAPQATSREDLTARSATKRTNKPQDTEANINNTAASDGHLDKEIRSGEDVGFVKPHPPREPSSDRARRRPRVRSAGKERTPHSESNPDHIDGSTSQVQTETRQKNNHITNNKTSEESPHSRNNNSHNEEGPKHKTENVVPDHDDSITDIIQSLKLNSSRLHSTGDDEIEAEYADENEAEYEDSEDEEVRNSGAKSLYMFSSPPKSAPRRNLSPEVDPTQLNQRLKNLQSHKDRSKLRQKILTEDLVSARGPRPESDFHSSDSSDQDERLHVKVTKSTPRSSPHGSPAVSSPGDISSIHPKSERSFQYLPHKDMLASPMTSQSRMCISKKALREIPKDDKRLSQPKPYDYSKYQMSDFSDSMEANMLQALKQETMDEDESSDESENIQQVAKQRHQVTKHVYGDDSPSSSSEDTSFSTWKVPPPADIAKHYQTEMRIHPARLSQDTLLNISNPRDCFSLYSPPIVLPSSEMETDNKSANMSSVKSTNTNIEKKTSPQTESQDTDDEDELDLLYDPVLNCYYDPTSCKYYELV